MMILPPQHQIKTGTEINVHGLTCVVETPQYELRVGKTWMNSSPAHYGYIKGYIGADGDAIDCYIGPEPSSRVVTVVNQNKVESLSVFDEHKVMLAYDSERSALRDYFSGHSRGHEIYRGHTTTNIREFKRWLAHGDLTRPIPRLVAELY
jgi:Inorganic Pyrophosphatase